jgi:catechol 2,3-dioxygenase-like lactoylglutathione lyase family enzyme
MSKFSGIDHVQLAMPVGAEDQARAFFTGVLGMPEIPKPPVLAVRGGVWFQCGSSQIHVGGEVGFVPAKKAHPALSVLDMGGLLADLSRQGVDIKPEETIGGLQRASILDTFGNRIELIELRRQQA